MLCKVCGQTSIKIFRRKIIQKYDVDYFQCPNCQFIQTEDPYWLSEAYKHPINIEDTGLVERNILFAKRSAALVSIFFNRNAKFLDYGGGYGLFVRLMRDYGFDFRWSDPYTENLFARGFEHINDGKNKYEIVTTFECFEHFADPLNELALMFKLSDSILFSTEIFRGLAPHPEEWDYYYFSHGQHIALYSVETLSYIAKKNNMNLYTNGKSFHLFTRKRLNNILFNVVLKSALFGIPSIVRMIIGSKTRTDSFQSKKMRNH